MCLKIVVLCLIVLIVVEFVCYTQALDPKDEGVCVVKQSTQQRRRKSYSAVVNKWCGHRKCIARKYKFETYLTWKNHTVCCKGWQYENELDICSPICNIECVGGKCVGPDQCQCEPPAYLDSNNTCIKPTCNSPCINANCYENNTCVCKEFFSRYNATHCFQCDTGYTADKDLNCVPVCDPVCVNGNCTGPNNCACNAGFKIKNSSVNNSICVPDCGDCSNGVCVAPGNCSCNSGYVYVGGLCRPVCSVPCFNGFCAAPDVCSCNDGYVKNTNGQCVKPKLCDSSCKGYCQDGVCVPPHKCVDNVLEKNSTLFLEVLFPDYCKIIYFNYSPIPY